MYKNFTLKKLKKGIIEGYSWEVKNTEAVVCLIHGIGEYAGRYERVASELNRNGIAVEAIDLRGHGNSAGIRGDCAPRKLVIDDIDSLVAHTLRKYPGKKIVIYGHSMGGNIVLDYRGRGAFNDIPAGYIISAPWIRLVQNVSPMLYKTVKAISSVIPVITLSSKIDESKLGNPDVLMPFADNPMTTNRITLRCAIEGYETGLKLESGTNEDNKKATEIPALIMHGTEDKICDIEGSRYVYQRLRDRGDDVSFIEWPGLYHEIHNGGDDSDGSEVIQRAVEFIKSNA